VGTGVDTLGTVGEGLNDLEANRVIIPDSLVPPKCLYFTPYSCRLVLNPRWASRRARKARRSHSRRARSRRPGSLAGLGVCNPGKISRELASLARKSKRLEGVCRQYVVVDLFLIRSTEDHDTRSIGETGPGAAYARRYHEVFALLNQMLTKQQTHCKRVKTAKSGANPLWGRTLSEIIRYSLGHLKPSGHRRRERARQGRGTRREQLLMVEADYG